MKNHKSTNQVAKASSKSVTKMQEVQSICPNDAPTGAQPKQGLHKGFCQNVDDIFELLAPLRVCCCPAHPERRNMAPAHVLLHMPDTGAAASKYAIDDRTQSLDLLDATSDGLEAEAEAFITGVVHPKAIALTVGDAEAQREAELTQLYHEWSAAALTVERIWRGYRARVHVQHVAQQQAEAQQHAERSFDRERGSSSLPVPQGAFEVTVAQSPVGPALPQNATQPAHILPMHAAWGVPPVLAVAAADTIKRAWRVHQACREASHRRYEQEKAELTNEMDFANTFRHTRGGPASGSPIPLGDDVFLPVGPRLPTRSPPPEPAEHVLGLGSRQSSASVASARGSAANVDDEGATLRRRRHNVTAMSLESGSVGEAPASPRTPPSAPSPLSTTPSTLHRPLQWGTAPTPPPNGGEGRPNGTPHAPLALHTRSPAPRTPSPGGGRPDSASPFAAPSSWPPPPAENPLGLHGTGRGTALRVTEMWEMLGHMEGVRCCAYTAGPSQLLTASDDCTLRLWDAATGMPLTSWTAHRGFVLGCAFAPGGRTIASCSDDETVRLWDAAGVKLCTLRKHRAAVNAVHWADLREPTLVSASADRTVRVWDAARQRKLVTLRGHEGAVACAQFAPDAAQVASVAADGTVRWWDWRASRETAKHRVHGAIPVSCAFSSQSAALLATANSDGTVRLFDVRQRLPAGALRGHNAPVTCARFSRSLPGARLASACQDGSVKVWDVRAGAALAVLNAHSGPVWHCLEEGDTVWSCGQDGKALGWRLEVQ